LRDVAKTSCVLNIKRKNICCYSIAKTSKVLLGKGKRGN
jgi:hypothetical protein